MNAHSLPGSLSDHDLERRARRRAGAKLGWYIHVVVYLAVNGLLALLSAMSGHHWAIFPALGWGLGLAVHGAVVFLKTAGVYQSLVQRERQRLAAQQDAW